MNKKLRTLNILMQIGVLLSCEQAPKKITSLKRDFSEKLKFQNKILNQPFSPGPSVSLRLSLAIP
jgi:hypothetical protein